MTAFLAFWLLFTWTCAAQDLSPVRADPIAANYLRLDKQLSAQGFSIQSVEISRGLDDNKVVAFLDQAIVKKISPDTDKSKTADLLNQYADTAEKLKAAYSDSFIDGVEYHAEAALARDLADRLLRGAIDARIGAKIIIVRYHECRQKDDPKTDDDLPRCSDRLMSTSSGLITDPL